MRLIDADALIEEALTEGAYGYVDALQIAIAPTVDAAPVRHGQWRVDGVYVVCSVCNKLTLSPIVKQIPTFKYCPNCGAKMDEEMSE